MRLGADEIVDLFAERVHNQSAVQVQMRAIREIYNGDLVLPMPEIDGTEKPAVPNLILQGVDEKGRRFASRMPRNIYQPTRRGSDDAQERADLRMAVTHGWWQHNKLKLQQYQRGRWWFAYGHSVSTVLPRPGGDMPVIKSWNPLDCYPAPRTDVWQLVPDNCIFTAQRTMKWLEQNHPAVAMELAASVRTRHPNKMLRPDDLYTVLMYIDDTDVTYVVTEAHPRESHNEWRELSRNDSTAITASVNPRGFLLGTTEHRMGVTPIVHPCRISLDRVKGQFDEIQAMYEMQAKLMALNLHAIVRSIFPETWIVEDQFSETQVTNPDPARGVTGRLRGGQIQTVQINPGLLVQNSIDNLERNQRTTARIPAEFGGESASNVRTDRRGTTILDNTIGYELEEAHEVYAAAIRIENTLCAIADMEHHNTRKTIAVEGFGQRGEVTYKPTDIFGESYDHKVSYVFAGHDSRSLTVELGQLVGAGMMSRETALELHPHFEDVDSEKDRLVTQGITDAVLSSLQAQAQQGALPIADAARIAELVGSDKMELFAAIQKVQEEAQERQAAQLPQGDPGLQPGLAAPGAGMEGTPIPEPPRGVENLRNGLRALVQSSQLAGRV